MASNISIRLFETASAPKSGLFSILLLKLDPIDNFDGALKAFRILRESFGAAQITLICLPAAVSMAESTGLFKRVVAFPAGFPSGAPGDGGSQSRIDDQIAQFRSSLGEAYFLAADFNHKPETRTWLDHVDAKYRAGFYAPIQKGLDILLPAIDWMASSPNAAGAKPPENADIGLTLLAHAIVESLQNIPLDPDLFGPGLELDQNQSYVALKIEKRIKIGVSLGAGSELRKWNNAYWEALLQRLIQKHNAVIVFLGGATDKADSQSVFSKLIPGSFLDLTAGPALADVPRYMGLLDAYIGCDTGLTHLAANLGIPTVNIFAGISNVSVWRARGPRVKTVYAELSCAPCHLRLKTECAYNNICMNAIVPDIVYACFEQVIAPHEG